RSLPARYATAAPPRAFVSNREAAPSALIRLPTAEKTLKSFHHISSRAPEWPPPLSNYPHWASDGPPQNTSGRAQPFVEEREPTLLLQIPRTAPALKPALLPLREPLFPPPPREFSRSPSGRMFFRRR